MAEKNYNNEQKQQRPNWDEYFLKIARVASERSTCLRRSVGCVIVKNHNIISTGYNGAPRGCPHCEVHGCIRTEMQIPSGQRHELCRGAHAEINAIAQAACAGVSTEGATAYCTLSPCPFCAKALINAGIVHLVIQDDYPDSFGLTLLNEAGVRVTRVKS